MEVKHTKNWLYWLAVAIAIMGILLVSIGLIANWVYMGNTLGVISFLSFVYAHWSFWVLFSGTMILLILYIAYKIYKKIGNQS